MPSLGADMDAGVVSRWMVKPGDEVHRGDIVAVVETEKSTIEVEIFENGVIEEIVVPEGEEVPVGTVLARVATRARALAAPPAPASTMPAAPPAPAPPAPAPPAPAPPAPAPASPARRPRPAAAPAAPAPQPARAARAGVVTSPMVRHLASTLGVDLSTVAGSGRGGAVTRADVERAAGAAPAGATVRSSPLARRLAGQLGVDLASATGTGPGGAVVEKDVRRLAQRRPNAGRGAVSAGPAAGVGARAPAGEAATAGAPAATEEKQAAADRQAAMRRAIGALMARSKREIPHYYLSTTIDMSRASAWLEQTNLDRPVTKRLVTAVLLLKATARAAVEVPEMNGFMVGDRFEPSRAVHVGVAISLRSGGVIAPAIHDADRLDLDDLMASLRDLVGRARTGVLRSSEMSDPTITLTNLGDLGVEAVFGVIYPPQVALVGFGRVAERPWASGGMIGARPCVTATLSADHRVSDGHRGGVFLATINHLLQKPEEL